MNQIPPDWHDTLIAANPNDVHDDHLTAGQRVADRVATVLGSWPFIITQAVFIAGWMTANVVGFITHWDPAPWILLNLLFSVQAAFSAPVIMMAQNRQSEKDRIKAQLDYEINLKAEYEIRAIHRRLDDEMGELLTGMRRLLDAA